MLLLALESLGRGRARIEARAGGIQVGLIVELSGKGGSDGGGGGGGG